MNYIAFIDVPLTPKESNFIFSHEIFNFDELIRIPCRPIEEFLTDDYGEQHIVNQPSVMKDINEKSIKRATVIKDRAMTITCKQMRTPPQIIDLGNGKYRYLTELECWRLQGY